MSHAKTPLTASKDIYQVRQFWGHPYLANLSYFTLRSRAFTWGPVCSRKLQREGRALYYLIRTLVGPELNCSPIEKMCLPLMFAVQKLRHCKHVHTMYVISKADPIKCILSRPVLYGRLAKWVVILEQYDLVHVS